MATNHYVNNADFLAALIKYHEDCAKAKEVDGPEPKIPNYIGECFLKIAEHLSRKPNFISYTYRDEMISDGVENCIMYFRNFDPAKSKNPFAYITQIIFYAFLRRIQKEKKQCYVKMKLFERADTTGALKDYIIKKYEIDPDKNNIYAEFLKLSETDVKYFEEKTEQKEKKKKERKDPISPLSEFMES